MPSDDESSDLSSLSSLSPVPSDVELGDLSDEGADEKKTGILKFFSKVSEQAPKSPSPPPRKRSPSPPHEYVLADNPDIAFIVMFRSRFDDAMPRSLPNFGPQELERDVVEPIPGDRVEHFLCALLGLLLNRKQDVKIGHYNRALEDAITSHKGQWPATWEDKSPLAAGASFHSMNPTERLTLLRYLVLWTMASSDAVKSIINLAYKQNRHEDDLNQARSVQPWGSDADKRRYYLVEGQDDTAFRVYRESNPANTTSRTWWSVAGTIEELTALSEKLNEKDGGPKAKKLSEKMLQAIPRFEAGEEKRKKREYRQMRKEQFKRPESGLSMYEGRTRGKRVKYTYSDDEDIFFSDSTGNRRSTRNTGINSPAEPTTTASGRQIRAPPRMNMVDDSASARGYGSEYDEEGSIGPGGRPRRSAAINHGTNGWTSNESKLRRAASDSEASESEAEFGDDEEDEEPAAHEQSEDEFDEDEVMGDDDLEGEAKSLVVKLAVTAPNLRSVLSSPVEESNDALPTPDTQDWPVKETQPVTATAEQAARPKEEQNVTPDTSLEPNHPNLETKTERKTEPMAVDTAPAQGPAPVSPVATTALAFRGSPEKPPAQTLPVTGASEAPAQP